MTKYEILSGVYLQVTPAGAYYAISAPESLPVRVLLRTLLARENAPALNRKSIKKWSAYDTEKSGELLWQLQEMGWINGTQKQASVVQGGLEQVLPGLLESLSREGKTLLADEDGFLLCHTMFECDAAERLAAYSAECLTLQERYRPSIRSLSIQSGAVAVVEAGGISQIGFWPLYIGRHRFALGLCGTPFFGQLNFRDLVWYLSVRYQ